MQLILDANNILHRAFWISQKEPLTTTDGIPVGCVYIVLNGIKKFAKQFNTTNIYACWDKKLVPDGVCFRKQILGEYKDGRDKEGLEDRHTQEKIIAHGFELLGVKNMYPYTVEADDVIAWLTHTIKDDEVVIASTDRDLLQLITPSVSYYNIATKRIITYDTFVDDQRIDLEHFLLYKAIMGDKSDNIAGVPKYGEVKARKLAMSNDLSVLTQEQQEIVKRNLGLVDLRLGYTYTEMETKALEYQFEVNKNKVPNLKKFEEFCKRYEFESFLNNMSEWQEIFNKDRMKGVLEKLFA